MNVSTNNAFLRRIKNKIRENLEKKIQFGEELISRMNSDGKTPFPGQIMRVYEVIENGTKRILYADATSFGKTYVASMILGLLNKNKGKRHKTLLIAPQQSLNTAWKEEEINSYLEGLGLGNGQGFKINGLRCDGLEEILRDSDIVCANYHKFDCLNSDKYVNAVLEVAKKFDIILFDECQNYTSFGKRGKNLKKIVDSTMNKYAFLLSANPGKNGLQDLGVPLYVLSPKEFPFAPYEHKVNPTAIKDMILAGKWFNSDRELVKKLFNLPELIINDPIYCEIGDYYAKKYLNVWQNGDLKIGKKIAELRKFLLLGRIKSREGKRDLENLLESFPKEDSVIIFNHLKTGVSEDLMSFLERFYGKGNVAMINGDVKSIRERVEISERFRDGKYKTLVLSYLTMGEGIPCIAGDRPIHANFLEIPYNHGQLNQGIGRPYRYGQRGDVHINFLLGKNEWLKDKMNELVKSRVLEEKYGVVFPRTWRDSLIDFDIYDIMQKKDEIDKEKVRNGLMLDDFEEAVMEWNEGSINSMKKGEKAGVLLSLPKKERESPMSLFTRRGPKLYGAGEKALYISSKGQGNFKKESKYMLDAHADPRIFDTTAGDTARLINAVVKGLEERGVEFKNCLDLGCGTGVVSRILEKEMVSLDLDKRMLKTWYGLGQRVHGFMTQLPFKNREFDLITASYSLFYNKQYDNERQIEKVLMEMNRAAKENAYAIVSLIRTSKKEDIENIANAMRTYGFNVLINDFFYGYKETKRKSAFKGAYLLVGRKEHDKRDYMNESFSAYVPALRRAGGGMRKMVYIDGPNANPAEDHKHFWRINSHEFRTRSGVPLDKLVEKIEI